MKRSLILAAGAAAILLVGAACGQQTDERVDSGEVTASEPLQSQIAAATPYVALDCTSLQGTPVDEPPASGTTLGAVTAIFQPNGAPAITLATDAQPATELGVAAIQEGSGDAIQEGDTVTVNYCGVGYGGQAVFDSSWTRGQPATFELSGLIPGWQQGLPGMKVGGQYLLVIPGELGYGEQGTQGIAPNETLAFVIEIVSIG
jgi:hypothetical protein